MSSEQLCLKWNNFESNIASFLDILRNGNDFVDVTITCENTNFKAHKLILSACSPYFKGIFQSSGLACYEVAKALRNPTGLLVYETRTRPCRQGLFQGLFTFTKLVRLLDCIDSSWKVCYIAWVQGGLFCK